MKQETLRLINNFIANNHGNETIPFADVQKLLSQCLLCEELEKKTKSKFNWYYFVDTKAYRTAYRGVYHENGYKIATNGYVLAFAQADYPQELEGKCVQKNGEIIELDDRGYLNYRSVIPSENDCIKIKLTDKSSDVSKEWKVFKQVHKNNSLTDTENGYVKIDQRVIDGNQTGGYLHVTQYVKLCKFCKEFNIEDIHLYYHHNRLCNVTAKSDNATCLVVSILPPQYSKYDINYIKEL